MSRHCLLVLISLTIGLIQGGATKSVAMTDPSPPPLRLGPVDLKQPALELGKEIELLSGKRDVLARDLKGALLKLEAACAQFALGRTEARDTAVLEACLEVVRTAARGIGELRAREDFILKAASEYSETFLKALGTVDDLARSVRVEVARLDQDGKLLTGQIDEVLGGRSEDELSEEEGRKVADLIREEELVAQARRMEDHRLAQLDMATGRVAEAREVVNQLPGEFRSLFKHARGQQDLLSRLSSYVLQVEQVGSLLRDIGGLGQMVNKIVDFNHGINDGLNSTIEALNRIFQTPGIPGGPGISPRGQWRDVIKQYQERRNGPSAGVTPLRETSLVPSGVPSPVESGTGEVTIPHDAESSR